MFHSFDGSSRAANWSPIEVDSGPADEGHKALVADFPWLVSHVLVMRKRAVVALRDLFDAHGELLPLVLEGGGTLFAFNAKIVDALDDVRSVIWRFPETGRIMYVKQPVLIADKVRDIEIFRLSYRGSPTYVSERFVERVHKAGLVGLDFEQVATVM